MVTSFKKKVMQWYRLISLTGSVCCTPPTSPELRRECTVNSQCRWTNYCTFCKRHSTDSPAQWCCNSVQIVNKVSRQAIRLHPDRKHESSPGVSNLTLMKALLPPPNRFLPLFASITPILSPSFPLFLLSKLFLFHLFYFIPFKPLFFPPTMQNSPFQDTVSHWVTPFSTQFIPSQIKPSTAQPGAGAFSKTFLHLYQTKRGHIILQYGNIRRFQSCKQTC